MDSGTMSEDSNSGADLEARHERGGITDVRDVDGAPCEGEKEVRFEIIVLLWGEFRWDVGVIMNNEKDDGEMCDKTGILEGSHSDKSCKDFLSNCQIRYETLDIHCAWIFGFN
jgi:hypothetical protein